MPSFPDLSDSKCEAVFNGGQALTMASAPVHWYYIDRHNNKQGPYSAVKMAKWVLL